jgi:hypothetical protein
LSFATRTIVSNNQLFCVLIYSFTICDVADFTGESLCSIRDQVNPHACRNGMLHTALVIPFISSEQLPLDTVIIKMQHITRLGKGK